jgi:hypothetical protein
MQFRALFCAFPMLALPFAFAAAQQPTASIRGAVADSIRHGPLAGATVVASPMGGSGATDVRDYTGTTDAHGKFSLVALPPGRYVLTVEHPWLDSTGLGVPAKNIDLTQQRSATVSLAVPSGATIRSVLCSGAARDTSTGLVAGYVWDARSGGPVAGARVVFAWNDFDVDRRTARATPLDSMAATTTGRDGTFRMCGLPAQRALLMQAQSGVRDATGAVEIQIPASGVLVETLRLDANANGTAALAGDVRRDGSLGAIAGAHVHLYGASDEAVTDARGSFSLHNVPIGTQSIEVTAVGFSPRRYALDVREDGIANIRVTMAAIAGELDSVKIVAARTSRLSRRAEFDDRSQHGSGQYITRDMIDNAHPVQTADLMQQVQGFYVVADSVYSSRGITRLQISTAQTPVNRVCQPTLYVDGALSAHTMDDIAPNSIYGIEIYASGSIVPPQYPSSNCGAIIIWTR